MAVTWRRPTRLVCGIGLGALFIAAMPAACLFPEYTFDGKEPGTGGGSTSTSTGGDPATTSTASTASGGTGGAGVGGAGAGGGTGGGVASSSTGVMPGTEDCLNGADDDSDGKADCADDECNPYTACVPTVPFGWSGFAALYEGVPAQEPACPGLFPSPNPYVGDHTPVAGAATCSACACGAAMNQTCNPPLEITVQNKVCGMNPNYTGKLMMPAGWNGACHSPNYIPGDVDCGGPCNVSVTSPPPTVTGGMCPPTGGQADVPQLSWAIRGKACGDPTIGGGCGAGEVCQPKPPLPFLPGLCISKPGDNACPADTFTQKHVFYGGAADTRGCAACACGAPTGGTCTIQMEIYSDTMVSTCNTEITQFDAGGCGDLNGNPNVSGRKATVTQQPTGATCTPSGGQPTGAVTPTDATTFCCIP